MFIAVLGYTDYGKGVDMRFQVPVVLVVCMVVMSCAMVRDLNMVSTDQELELGAQFAQQIEQEVTLYTDPEVAGYIDDLGQRLVRHSRRADIPYSFKVVDDPETVNAFALPGGYVYVYRGLILRAENESELAGVIAHEIGHVVARHGAKLMTKKLGVAAIVQLVAGNDPDLWRKLAADFVGIGGSVGILKYSRDHEYEADAHAVEETYAAGIDPNGMATFFEKLLEMEQREPTKVEQWLSTHPLTRDRIAAVRERTAALPAKTGIVRDSDRFRRIQAMLK